MADDLTYHEAVQAMKVKVAMGYLALVLFNLLILARWQDFTAVVQTLWALSHR